MEPGGAPREQLEHEVHDLMSVMEPRNTKAPVLAYPLQRHLLKLKTAVFG